jgi:hypothetical protein
VQEDSKAQSEGSFEENERLAQLMAAKEEEE